VPLPSLLVQGLPVCLVLPLTSWFKRCEHNMLMHENAAMHCTRSDIIQGLVGKAESLQLG